MAVTIKEIAQRSGVSRGTVDRVLNHRGNVSADTERLVTQVATEMGYRPNIAGKALAARKKNFTIGVVLCSEENEFFDDVLEGIHRAESESADYGVSVLIRTTKGYEVEQQLKIIEELRPQIHFLILNAINDERIVQIINELYEENIMVITINTDVKNSKRICHVGSNYSKSGETAGGMMGLITGGKGKVGIASGSQKILGHSERVKGFTRVCESRYPGIEIIDMIETEDDNRIAYDNTISLLHRNPEVEAVYIVAAGFSGVCKAIKDSNRLDIKVIACDCTKTMSGLIQNGMVQATICQQPFTQGYKSVNLAVQYLVNGIAPYKDIYAVKNEIRILENM